MSDTKEEDDKTQLSLSSGKLTLSKNLDAMRSGRGVPQGRSKTVTVEVRKNRALSRTGTPGRVVEVATKNASPLAARSRTDDAAAGSEEENRTLTQSEKRVRMEALKSAGEEAKREQERSKQEQEERERRRAEEAAQPPVVAETSVVAAEEDEDKKRGKDVKKKKDDKFTEAEEEEWNAKNKKKKTLKDRLGEVLGVKEKEEKVDYEALAYEDADLIEEARRRKEEEDLILQRNLQKIGFGEDDYEDYSEEDDAEEEDPTVLTPPVPQPAQRSSAVRPVKGAERVILSQPDAEKLKKYLRSEKRSDKPGASHAPRHLSSRFAAPAAPSESNTSDERQRSSHRRGRGGARRMVSAAPKEKVYREVVVPESITVQDLANRMTERTVDVIKELMKLGVMATPQQVIDPDTAELVVSAFGHTIKRVSDADVENALVQAVEDDTGELLPRPPVVTIMGHVDHGKTSLLDAIRQTDVAAGEAGGITQHIGAYQVNLANGQKITFLDTPGHEAFTAMRARGANMTDIVVLVVAADDGIMEQTKEAINHAKAAGVPIIVAINKVDKPEANPQRVRQELMNYELVAEEFGGDVITVEVSAKAKTNLDKLEESILVQAEMLELKANPDRIASGAVVESKVDKGRGVVATLLVQSGTLKVGDIVVAGSAYGKVRALTDYKGKMLDKAGPSMPVEVLGLAEAPEAGERFDVVESERVAREVTEYRIKKAREKQIAARNRMSLEDFFSRNPNQAGTKELPLVIKADVQGSVEAIAASLEKLSTDEVAVRVIHSGVGGITESDVSLCQASGAIIVGFNVRATGKAKELAAKEGVDIRYYSIIYELVDHVKAAMSGMLSPEKRENLLGYAEIREVFVMSKYGKVAGCMVTQGMVKRGAKVRLLRDNIVIHEGTLKTLRRFKDDVKEVKEGYECGMAFENYEDIRAGDQIEAFEIEEIARSI